MKVWRRRARALPGTTARLFRRSWTRGPANVGCLMTLDIELDMGIVPSQATRKVNANGTPFVSDCIRHGDLQDHKGSMNRKLVQRLR